MIGAALESALICLICLHPRKFNKWEGVPRKKGHVKPVFDWPLAQLLGAANHTGWVPRALTDEDDFDHDVASLGDYTKVIHLIRNFVHSARYLEDYYPRRITLRRLAALIRVYNRVAEPLFYIEGRSLTQKVRALEKK